MNKKAFTLAELLVAITIIVIMALGATQLSFKNLSDNQRLEIFAIKVVAEIEKIRTDSLIGKGVGLNLDVPSYWEIGFSTNNSGSMVTQYNNGTIDIQDTTLQIDPNYSIAVVKCNTIKKDNEYSVDSGTGTIKFIGEKISLGGDCDKDKHKIINIELKYKVFSKTIEINTINGLISTK